MSKYDSIHVVTKKEPLYISRFVFVVEFKMTRTGESIICEDNFSMRCAHPALAMCNSLASSEPYTLDRIQDQRIRANLVDNYDVEHKGYTFHPPHNWSVRYIDQFGRQCEVELNECE